MVKESSSLKKQLIKRFSYYYSDHWKFLRKLRGFISIHWKIHCLKSRKTNIEELNVSNLELISDTIFSKFQK